MDNSCKMDNENNYVVGNPIRCYNGNAQSAVNDPGLNPQNPEIQDFPVTNPVVRQATPDYDPNLAVTYYVNLREQIIEAYYLDLDGRERAFIQI